MLISRKISLSFVGILLAVLVFAFVFAKTKAKQGLPDYSKDIVLNNLQDEVEVYRDDTGIPHIFASSEQDLYRSTGYLMAQERMWQMDLLRRIPLGRLSELFGEEYVDTDILMRSLRFSEKSNKILQDLPEEVSLTLEAFCDGVNQYIEQYKGDYPVEFFVLGYEPEKWEPVHSVNLIGFMAWDLKAGWNELLLSEISQQVDSMYYKELLPVKDKENTVVFDSEQKALLAENKLLLLDKLDDLGVDVFFGSNNWAVSGDKSVTGMPIVANDMHLPYSVPGAWMQMHQKVESKLNVSGLVLPGQPFVIVGHNDSITWGMTNTYVDNLDYYQEHINPEDSNQYMFDGEWNDFSVRTENIKVSNDSTIVRKYRFNHRGPVVSDFKASAGNALTIRWVGDEESNEMRSIYKLNRAQNWSEFKAAMRDFKAASQNVVYGDKSGNIGLYACAGVPIRKRNSAVFELLPGWTSEYDWQGLVPFDELPHEYNPSRSYVSSANNKTTDSTYPYHIATWYYEPYRINRIREMLEEKEKLSVEDFMLMQNDLKSKLAERIVLRCFNEMDEAGLTEKEEVLLKQLQAWDGSMDKGLIEPTVVEFFQYFLIKEVFEDEMGGDLFKKFSHTSKLFQIAFANFLDGEIIHWIDDVETEEIEEYSDVLGSAFSATVSYLDSAYSKNEQTWKWGRIHQLTLKHPLSKVEVLDKIFKLNRGPYAVNGGNHTIAPYSYPILDPTGVRHGASHRHIFSLENWDLSKAVVPTGNSGVVSSEFYCNQTERYINGGYFDEYFSLKAIEENARYKIKILPSGN